MSEQADRLKQRIFQFAIDVIDLITQFSKSDPGATVVRQLAKSATSVGANYRAALRASWEYHVENFLGMLQLACARILLRHL